MNRPLSRRKWGRRAGDYGGQGPHTARGQGPHPARDRWMVSYADFVTLLFAFFVVMYSISQADISKLKKVSDSIRGAFGEIGTDIKPKQLQNQDAAPSSEREELENMKNLIQEVLRASPAANDAQFQQILDLRIDGSELAVSLSAQDLYMPGKREVAADLHFVLDRMALALAKTAKPIQIRGFSESEEGKKSKFGDGYRLGFERALWVSEYFASRHGFSPERMSVASFGSYHPIAPTNSQWRAGLNRRLEIIVGRERASEAQSNPSVAPIDAEQ